MTTPLPSESDVRALSASRGWLIIGGVLSIIVGFIAMGSPYFFSIIIAQYLGIAALVIGVSLLMLGLGARK